MSANGVESIGVASSLNRSVSRRRPHPDNAESRCLAATLFGAVVAVAKACYQTSGVQFGDVS